MPVHRESRSLPRALPVMIPSSSPRAAGYLRCLAEPRPGPIPWIAARKLLTIRRAIPANRDAFPGRALPHLPRSAIIPVNVRLDPREQEAP